MNKGTLQLFWDDKVTLWQLTLWFEHPKIYFIAPPWKNNESNISCIPQGLYNVTRHNSADHPNTFEILYVPNRTNILIHPGNYACDVTLGDDVHKSDSLGCFMPGFDYDRKVPMIKSSVKAMEYLLENIKENWCIEVRHLSPPEDQ